MLIQVCSYTGEARTVAKHQKTWLSLGSSYLGEQTVKDTHQCPNDYENAPGSIVPFGSGEKTFYQCWTWILHVGLLDPNLVNGSSLSTWQSLLRKSLNYRRPTIKSKIQGK